MNKRICKKFCAVLAALLLAVTLASPAAYAETAKEKVDRLEAALNQEKAELAALEKNKANAQATKKKLQNQAAILKEQLAALLETITDAEEAVVEKEQEITVKQAEIDEQWGDFKAQVCAMQKMHDTGAVAMLASCDSLYELLTFGRTMQEVSEYNDQVLDNMKTQKEILNGEKEELEVAREELETQKAQLEVKAEELSGNIKATDAAITQAEADAKAQAEVVSLTQAEYDRAEAEWQAYVKAQILAAQGGNADFTSDMFIWPLPGYNRITTRFGETQNLEGYIKPGHKGIDVGTSGRSPAILAASSGTVTLARYSSSYGNYVIINHGAGFSTLYAHMNSMTVSTGQEVEVGDVIGYVGNTGWSYGNHLHLEVRVNGNPVDPFLYFTAK